MLFSQLLIFELINLLFLNILKISKISFWTFWKINWLFLASWALFTLNLYKAFKSFQNSTAQIAMISKAMTNFWSKFQIQILSHFYWRHKKVAKIKLVMVMICFDKSNHLFNLYISGYYFNFPWSRFKYAECKGSLTQPVKFSPKTM